MSDQNTNEEKLVKALRDIQDICRDQFKGKVSMRDTVIWIEQRVEEEFRRIRREAREEN